MAGRPLRRARKLRENPLMSYRQRSKPSMADTDAIYRTMFRPGAEASYKDAFDRVPLDIHVLFGNYDDLPDEHRLFHSFGNKPVVVLSIGTNIQPGRPSGKPGDPNRDAPFTPFVLLHRLGDSVRGGSWTESVVPYDDEEVTHDKDAYESGKEFFWLTRSLQSAYGERPQRDLTGRVQYETDYLQKVNAGVGTAAGRLNALGAVSETWSDLFAKFLLTGRFAFDPEAGTFSKEIRQMRREWALLAHQHIINVISALRTRGILVQISI